MINKDRFPIIEFDEEDNSIINPSWYIKDCPHIPERLIITFFRKTIDKLIEDKRIEHLLTLSGENDLIVYKFVDSDVAIIHGTIGGPACGGYLDELTGFGVTKVMFCGGGGVLDKSITVGIPMIVTSAIRDEGMSYHYVAPSRYIDTNAEVVKEIENHLNSIGMHYITGRVWTTDAFYRETKSRIQARKEEEAQIVDMEQAGCIAVAQFRKIKYGAIIYAGDDVSGEVWDQRDWKSRTSIRDSLVEVCHDILLKM